MTWVHAEPNYPTIDSLPDSPWATSQHRQRFRPDTRGSGVISPGSNVGILTLDAIDPGDGVAFDFDFTATGAPSFSTASASVNDLIRMTDATPWTSALSSSNQIRIFINSLSLANGQILKGGLFTDHAADFWSLIENATFSVFTTDPGGSTDHNGQSYSLYDGPLTFSFSTVAQEADFGSGTISGRILQILIEADVTTYEGWKLSNNLSGDAALDTADDDQDLPPDGIRSWKRPEQLDRDKLPSTLRTNDGGQDYLELQLTRPNNLQALNYIPQTTIDLNNWPADSNGISNASPTPQTTGTAPRPSSYRRAQAIGESDTAYADHRGGKHPRLKA